MRPNVLRTPNKPNHVHKCRKKNKSMEKKGANRGAIERCQPKWLCVNKWRGEKYRFVICTGIFISLLCIFMGFYSNKATQSAIESWTLHTMKCNKQHKIRVNWNEKRYRPKGKMVYTGCFFFVMKNHCIFTSLIRCLCNKNSNRNLKKEKNWYYKCERKWIVLRCLIPMIGLFS